MWALKYLVSSIWQGQQQQQHHHHVMAPPSLLLYSMSCPWLRAARLQLWQQHHDGLCMPTQCQPGICWQLLCRANVAPFEVLLYYVYCAVVLQSAVGFIFVSSAMLLLLFFFLSTAVFYILVRLSSARAPHMFTAVGLSSCMRLP